MTLVAMTLATGAERKSWSKVRYLGGTVSIKTSRYDWNTTIVVTPATVLITIDPASVFDKRQVVRFETSKITGLFLGASAWRKTSEAIAPQTLRRTPTLFGVLVDDIAAAILYDTDDGKRGALLFESPEQYLIIRVLSQLSGKPVE